MSERGCLAVGLWRFPGGDSYSHAGGYVNDARLDGGVFFETHPEVYQRLVDRFGANSPQVPDLLWRINEAPIQHAIADGLDFDYSLARTSPERYRLERDAVQLYMEGEVGAAFTLLERDTIPSRLREVDLLLQAGYQPVPDDAAQIIHWRLP